MNTRLQVEHPVTEQVTGLDLVRLQLLVAAGEPLPAESATRKVSGHAIEARLYAEDAAGRFLPATGALHRFASPSRRASGSTRASPDGSVVSPHYDPMLAKVIASRPHPGRGGPAPGPRPGAQPRSHGVTTNRDLLVPSCASRSSWPGGTDTGYLTRHDPAALAAAPRPEATALHAGAALARQAARRRAARRSCGTLPAGWRNVYSAPQQVSYRRGRREVRRRPTTSPAHRPAPSTATRGRRSASTSQRGPRRPGSRRARRQYRVHPVRRQPLRRRRTGRARWPRCPVPRPGAGAPAGSLLAPMPGLVLRVLADVGRAVAAGDSRCWCWRP